MGAYTDFASDVYAPAARGGTLQRDNSLSNSDVKTAQLDTYAGLLELESSLPDSLTTPRVARPTKLKSARTPSQRSQAKLQAKLQELDTTMRATRRLSDSQLQQPPLRFCERVEPPPVRPPTPTVEGPTEDAEECELALVLLQKMLRGRAAQTAMYEAKLARRELVAEVRATHALLQAEQEVKAQQKQQVMEQQAAAAQARQREQQDQQIVGEVAGAIIGQDLDFLSKELVRLQEERRIHAFAMLAERERRNREAAESGRRAEEERQRARQDEIFRQITNVFFKKKKKEKRKKRKKKLTESILCSFFSPLPVCDRCTKRASSRTWRTFCCRRPRRWPTPKPAPPSAKRLEPSTAWRRTCTPLALTRRRRGP